MNNEFQNVDLSQLAQKGKELTPNQEQVTEKPTQTQTEVEQVQAPVKPELPPDDDFLITPTEDGTGLKVEAAPPGGYEGPGIVIDMNKENKQEEMPKYTGITPDTLVNIEKYQKEMDEEIERQRQLAEKKKQEQEEEKDPEERAKENEESFNEAIVIIDKLGMGQVINFTEEERKKLEKVKKIRLEEVETVQLSTIKTKRSKKGSLDTILKRQVSAHTTPIILPASGYTAVMKGCSTYELISLMGGTQNRLIDTVQKWSLIHSKIVSTSIGDMDFDTFLKETANIDYHNFIYGLLCSTYPDDDKIPITCPKCGVEYEHHYSVRSLIRAEKMSDKLKSLVAHIVDHSHTAEMAAKVHQESAVNMTTLCKLPISGIIMELYVQSAFDFIYKTIKGLDENKEDKYNQAAILSTAVKRAYVEDPDNPGEYFEYDEPMDITKIIYSLQDTDILVLTKKSDSILSDLSFEYGLMNVQCPNEKCRYFEESIPFEIETILFYRYQQAMNTVVD